MALSLRSVGVEPYFFFYVAALAVLTFIASALMPTLAGTATSTATEPLRKTPGSSAAQALS